ncbi:MAG: choloylglycine hydrolase [Eubacteriales bacterium]|nr:choloylglycine hydrolase [Eubacteriales bacterium]
MCTAATYQTKDHYFGRNLDLEYSYHEEVTVTPRNYPFRFRCMGDMPSHYAMIGMATVIDDYPLYYEATNEKGLSVAGLNFVGNTVYFPPEEGKENLAQFELIPYLLGRCADLAQARELLGRINMTDIRFSEQFPPSSLHWLISDRSGSIVAESVAEGLKVYENPVGVLTNNPPFPMQLFNLNNYRALSPSTPQDTFAPGVSLQRYSNGMGGMGLPGDFSSMSRFVRAAFVKLNSLSGEGESESVSQFFHILGSVAQYRGSVHIHDGKFEITEYSCCCNTDKGLYYYTTYENSRISCVDMHKEDLDGRALSRFPLVRGQQFLFQN